MATKTLRTTKTRSQKAARPAQKANDWKKVLKSIERSLDALPKPFCTDEMLDKLKKEFPSVNERSLQWVGQDIHQLSARVTNFVFSEELKKRFPETPYLKLEYQLDFEALFEGAVIEILGLNVPYIAEQVEADEVTSDPRGRDVPAEGEDT